MTDKTAWAHLRDGTTILPHAVVQSLTHSLDDGFSASLQFNANFNPDVARDKAYNIQFQDRLGNAVLTTPDMYLGPRSLTDARSISQAGLGGANAIGAATANLKKPNQSFNTWQDTSTAAVIAILATQAGVTINGAPSWWISEEDSKQAKLDAFLMRILRLAAYDLVAEWNGTLSCVAWEAEGASLAMPFSTLVRNYDPWGVYTGLRVGKFSSTPDGSGQTYDFFESGAPNQSLNSPLIGPVVNDLSLVDGLGAVSFLDEDGGLLAFYSFKPNLYQNNTPFDGAPPATQMTVVIDPIFGNQTTDFPSPVRIEVIGTPTDALPSGIDREFLHPAPTGNPDTSLGAWPAQEELIDSAWPSQGYATTRKPHILAKMNSQADTLAYTREIIDSRPRLNQEFSYGGRLYKVWSITWDFGSQSTQLELRRKIWT